MKKINMLKNISIKEWLKIILITLAVFAVFGTVTALWQNPFFTRMTPISWVDFVILSLEAVLLGLFFGISRSVCATKKMTAGGLFGFLGFGCSICNKLLLLLFSSSFLLTYFEPIKYYLGFLGILILAIALRQKLLVKQEVG